MSAVCIAGMHRSGTSMIARMLNIGGLHLGSNQDIIPPAADNPAGFWENSRFVQINDGILSAFGGTWDRPPAFPPDWNSSELLEPLEPEVRRLIDGFSNQSTWGWKDPRNTITLPFWQLHVPHLKVVNCLRNPLDVAESLAARNGFSREHGIELWYTYYRRLLATAAEGALLTTHYSVYFSGPEDELRRVLDFIGIQPNARAVAQALGFARESLNHKRYSVVDLISEGVPAKIIRLYAELCSQAGPVYWKTAARGISDAALTDGDLLRDVSESDHAVPTLVEVLAQRAEVARTAANKLSETNQALHRDLAHRTLQEQELRRQLADEVGRSVALQSQLTEISASRTWKIALTLRHLHLALISVQVHFGLWLQRLRLLPRAAPRAWRLIREQGFKSILRRLEVRDSYAAWIAQNAPTEAILDEQRQAAALLTRKPLLSIIMPVYNVDLVWLRAAIESVRAQTYPNWELCIADDASTKHDIRPFLEEMAAADPRIKITLRNENGHISRASNSAIGLATGEFLCTLDHDDILYPDALFEIARRLDAQSELDIIYSDSDLIVADTRTNPFFKPDWSPELFTSNNYLNHLTALRKALVDKVGGFRAGYEGSQDYDLYLRIVQETSSPRIAHVPKVLYGWRAIPGSAALGLQEKTYAIEAGRRALSEAIRGGGPPAEAHPGILPNTFQVRRQIVEHPLVSVIVVPGPQPGLVEGLLQSIEANSGYDKVEILVPGQQQGAVGSMALTKAFAREGAEDTPQFRNRAAQEANGEYLLYVAPGIRFKTPSSFVLMLEHAQRREIGIVGPRILGEKSLVYSAGITLRIQSGVYAHLFNSCPDNGYDYFLNVPRNCLAVSELCQLVSRRAIEKAGGFGEHWESALLANLDFSLRLHKAGYRHLYTPFVTVYNQTPSPETIPTLEVTGFRELWGTEYGLDPYYSPNFSQERADFAL